MFDEQIKKSKRKNKKRSGDNYARDPPPFAYLPT